MHHILTNGKYYLFSVVAHILLLAMLPGFLSASFGGNSLQPQEAGEEKVLKVSFNKNYNASAQNNFKQSVDEIKNSNDKNLQEDSEKNIDSKEQGDYGAGAGFFKKAYLLSEIVPDYPAYAFRNGIEGTVLIDASIDSFGKVSKTEIVVSSSYSVLDRAALRCVAKAKFAPASYMGNPAPDTLRIAVNFHLKKES